jgi:hypothetical protein
MTTNRSDGLLSTHARPPSSKSSRQKQTSGHVLSDLDCSDTVQSRRSAIFSSRGNASRCMLKQRGPVGSCFADGSEASVSAALAPLQTEAGESAARRTRGRMQFVLSGLDCSEGVQSCRGAICWSRGSASRCMQKQWAPDRSCCLKDSKALVSDVLAPLQADAWREAQSQHALLRIGSNPCVTNLKSDI